MTSEIEVTREQLKYLADRIEIVSIKPLECHAVRHSGEKPSQAIVTLETARASEPERLNYKFDLTCKLSDGAESVVAEVRVVIIAQYKFIAEGDASEETFDAFGASIALRNAFPYLRQNVQDLGTRIGLYGLTLGLMRPEAPTTIPVSLEASSF
ncbi:hypothetical protein AB0M28_33795 [Streptomyces sp. NPDC051940]|uniref:hypothetical protein n=1 Tax=Streptomyces sp. NPDC051940 TaxID=3155675 RepID=UPI00341BEBDB